jgi:hypothetical protein
MKRLLLALMMVLLSAVPALAHGGFGLRVNIGLPFFFPFYYGYPASYGYYQPYSYYQPPPRVYYAPRYEPGTVVENVYVNGYLVERRVKVYRDRFPDDERRHERSGDYYR